MSNYRPRPVEHPLRKENERLRGLLEDQVAWLMERSDVGEGPYSPVVSSADAAVRAHDLRVALSGVRDETRDEEIRRLAAEINVKQQRIREWQKEHPGERILPDLEDDA